MLHPAPAPLKGREPYPKGQCAYQRAVPWGCVEHVGIAHRDGWPDGPCVAANAARRGRTRRHALTREYMRASYAYMHFNARDSRPRMSLGGTLERMHHALYGMLQTPANASRGRPPPSSIAKAWRGFEGFVILHNLSGQPPRPRSARSQPAHERPDPSRPRALANPIRRHGRASSSGIVRENGRSRNPSRRGHQNHGFASLPAHHVSQRNSKKQRCHDECPLTPAHSKTGDKGHSSLSHRLPRPQRARGGEAFLCPA